MNRFLLFAVCIAITIIGLIGWSMQGSKPVEIPKPTVEAKTFFPTLNQEDMKDLQILYRLTELAHKDDDWANTFMGEQLTNWGLRKIGPNVWIRDGDFGFCANVAITPGDQSEVAILTFLQIASEISHRTGMHKSYLFVTKSEDSSFRPYSPNQINFGRHGYQASLMLGEYSLDFTFVLKCRSDSVLMLTDVHEMQRHMFLICNGGPRDMYYGSDGDKAFFAPTSKDTETATIFKLSNLALLIWKEYEEGRLHAGSPGAHD